ncbi:MAG: hypothetical protein V7K21_02700 [Nostoc sp.]|uniref:hypothetical protein n=1 Tax=Nostoc sp. TaxID=1180 RepID=UPI002FFAE948
MSLSMVRQSLHCKGARPIACPGLGTGIGRVPYTEAARQMALAYNHFLYPPKHLNCIVAAQRQLQIWEGGDLL